MWVSVSNTRSSRFLLSKYKHYTASDARVSQGVDGCSETIAKISN
jgi:hypothetical protein